MKSIEAYLVHLSRTVPRRTYYQWFSVLGSVTVVYALNETLVAV